MGFFGFNKKKNMDDFVSVKGASVKILGEGCDKCDNLVKETRMALEELNMETDIEHVTELVEIVKFGVMTTPSLVVDGEVVSKGEQLKKDQVIELLKKVRI